MKILIVTTISTTMNFFEDLIKKIHAQDYDIHFATDMNEGMIKYDIKNYSIKTHQIDFSRNPLSKSNIKAYNQMKDLLEEIEFDVIHTHTPIASMITRACIKKNKYKTKMIYTAHGFHFYEGAPTKNWLIYYPIEKILSYKTDVLITINSEDYQLAKKKFKSKNLVLLNGPGINFDIVKSLSHSLSRKELGFSESDFLVVFGGELNENKNQILLIEAMSKVIVKYPSIKLLLVGEGPNYNSYRHEIKRLGLEKNVYLLGYRNDLKEIIYLSDLGISSSKREGLGLFLIESLLLSKPVIGTDNRGSKEIIKDGENGFLVEHSSDIIADKIIQLYKDERLYNSMVQNTGIELYKFEENNINERLIKLYEE